MAQGPRARPLSLATAEHKRRGDLLFAARAPNSYPCCIRRRRNWWTGQCYQVNVTNRVTYECDSMMRVNVSLELRQAVSLDEFLLKIPLASKLRDAFHP